MSEQIKENIKSHWFKVLMALIAAGLLGHAFDFWDLSVKREDNYIDRYIQCEREIVNLNKKLNTMGNRLSMLELASTDIPFPFWIKDRDQKVIHLSNAYDRVILDPLGINTDDFLYTRGEILGPDFLNTIIENDRQVIRENRVIEFKEYVPGIGKGTSYKFPINTKQGRVSGTGGIWIPDKK